MKLIVFSAQTSDVSLQRHYLALGLSPSRLWRQRRLSSRVQQRSHLFEHCHSRSIG
jgi:hypothetical protein